MSECTVADVARLLDRSVEWRWRGLQSAISHGERERAQLLEEKARQLEELAEAVRAHEWKLEIDSPPLSPAEHDELQSTFDRVVAERDRDELAERARRARWVEEPRGARWVEAALEAEAETVRAAPVGLRNATLSRSAWSLSRLACDGTLTEGQLLETLVPAAIATGLSSRESHACIRAALRRRCRGAAA